MKDDPLILDIKDRINNEMIRISEGLGKGSAASYEDYKSKVGIVRGLKDAIRLIDEVIEIYIKDIDNDEL